MEIVMSQNVKQYSGFKAFFKAQLLKCYHSINQKVGYRGFKFSVVHVMWLNWIIVHIKL